jgi:AmiR/NasT family two-component response regulator
MQADPPRVLLGNLEPILRLGMRAVLTEAGLDVVGQEQHAQGIVSEVSRLLPDAVVLARDDDPSRTLCERVRRACPHTTVILCARDETFMEVIGPGARTGRLVSPNAIEDLRSELAASRSRNLVEE